jgi:RecA/RadA recombinase
MNNSAAAAIFENEVDEEIVVTVSDDTLEAAAGTKRGEYFTFNFGNPVC